MNQSNSTDSEHRKGIRVTLREIDAYDLDIFFSHLSDPDAIEMAAFTVDDPNDRHAFNSHWERLMKNDSIIKKTILFDGDVAGHVMKFEQFGNTEVTYWIGKEYWGKGIVTEALNQFLAIIDERPLYARAAKDNLASIRVLEKCGFVLIAIEKGFAKARGREIEEVVMKRE
jgi:RimJ/RimL family protein N-acetyltransferase